MSDFEQLIVKPCPFCGKEVDLEDPDTCYPNGSGWMSRGKYRSYHRYNEVPEEQWCWLLHCTENMGGCGAEVNADSKQEVIDKWNRRV